MFADFDSRNNNDDFLDDFRQKLNTPSQESFEERKNEISRSKNVFVGTVSGIALAAVVGWFVLSPRYAAQNNAEVPVIRRPQTAVKVQPSEPGGMEIQNQDKSIYDIIEKQEGKTPAVENLLPPPEEPQLPTITADATPTPVVGDSEVLQKAENIIKTAEEKAAGTTQAQPQDAQNVEVKAAPAPQAVAAKEEQAPAPEVTIKEAAATTPAAPEVEKVEIPTKVATAETPATAAVSGNWMVQLLASPNRQSIDNSWNGLVKKYAVLKDQPREIETADLGAKGTYYRLHAGAFADKAGADKLCNDIKALGGTCIVKKK